MLLYETLREEREEGCKEGREEGRSSMIRELIAKKMEKNFDMATIAEQVELPLEQVEVICQEIRACAGNIK